MVNEERFKQIEEMVKNDLCEMADKTPWSDEDAFVYLLIMHKCTDMLLSEITDQRL